MKIEIGLTRLALVGRSYTLKLPRINLIGPARRVKNILKREGEGKWHSLADYFAAPTDRWHSFRHDLFKGIAANWREARLSAQLQDVVVPTRFSFLGILNIQDTADQSRRVDVSFIWGEIYGQIGKEEMDRDFPALSHAFAHPENYGFHEGRPKLLDYGNKRIGEFLLSHAAFMRKLLSNL
jgi:hypothetical protein